MELTENIIVVAGWTKAGLMRFTIKEFLYPEVLADRNIYAALNGTTAFNFTELIGLAHFKENMSAFVKTSDAVADISHERFGSISTSRIDKDGFANWNEIMDNAKHAEAGVLYIEDVCYFESDTLREILELAKERGIKVILNDTSETKLYTLGLNLQVEMKHLKHRKTYESIGAKVYVGQYKKDLEHLYLKELGTDVVRTFPRNDY